jgi:hypothetical protein
MWSVVVVCRRRQSQKRKRESVRKNSRNKSIFPHTHFKSGFLGYSPAVKHSARILQGKAPKSEVCPVCRSKWTTKFWYSLVEVRQFSVLILGKSVYFSTAQGGSVVGFEQIELWPCEQAVHTLNCRVKNVVQSNPQSKKSKVRCRSVSTKVSDLASPREYSESQLSFCGESTFFLL